MSTERNGRICLIAQMRWLHDFSEMPVVNGICALTQIVKLFGDTVVGEDGVKAQGS